MGLSLIGWLMTVWRTLKNFTTIQSLVCSFDHNVFSLMRLRKYRDSLATVPNYYKPKSSKAVDRTFQVST